MADDGVPLVLTAHRRYLKLRIPLVGHHPAGQPAIQRQAMMGLVEPLRATVRRLRAQDE